MTLQINLIGKLLSRQPETDSKNWMKIKNKEHGDAYL